MAITQLDLIPEEPKQFALIFALLKQVTSISVIGEYLKSRNVPHSAGSWDELRDKRLLPGLASGAFTVADLIGLLSEVEEYGRAHTFLFKCKREEAAPLVDAELVAAKVAKQGLGKALGAGRVLDQPAKPTISTIRVGEDDRGKFLSVKIVEMRTEHKYAGEERVGDFLTKKWQVIDTRAVNVMRLYDHGLLEIRIASHYSSTKYNDDVLRVWQLVGDLLPPKPFKPDSLGLAKYALWINRADYSDKVRFSSSTLRDSAGTTMSAAAGLIEGGDLSTHKGVTDGMAAFLKGDSEAYCESSNLYWIAGKDGALPSKDIHMILPELRNEFAIPANCSKADYEYVFDQLRALQK